MSNYSRVTITEYRGFEIQFDPNYERFIVDIDTAGADKKTFASAIKFIDNYIKENENFKPFKIIKNPFGYRNTYEGGRLREVLTVVGIRKDERLVISKDGDKKEQLSDYYEKDYLIYDESMLLYFQEIDKLLDEKKDIENKLNSYNSKFGQFESLQYYKTNKILK